MKAIEIIAIIFSVLVVAGVIINSIINKRKGKTGCSCGCSGCPNASTCGKACNTSKGSKTESNNVESTEKSKK